MTINQVWLKPPYEAIKVQKNQKVRYHTDIPSRFILCEFLVHLIFLCHIYMKAKGDIMSSQEIISIKYNQRMDYI